MNTDHTLDLSGLNCPLPILRAKKALAGMESGATILVIATDPGAPGDFAAFCRQTGNGLLSSDTMDDGSFQLVLQRK
jgi:tRNA 2-thiouridine synthesizing protein A